MKAKVSRRALMGATVALLAGCGPIAVWRQGVDFFVVNERLLLSGQINLRTPAAFADVLARNPDVRTVVLQDLRETHEAASARKIGRIIRARGLGTALQSDSAVEGAAAYIFIAGTTRTMVQGARISLRVEPDGAADLAYFEEMLGTQTFYRFRLQAASADGIHTITQQEIARFGLLTSPVIAFK